MKKQLAILLTMAVLCLTAACSHPAPETPGSDPETATSAEETQSLSALSTEPDSADGIMLPEETEPSTVPATATPPRTSTSPTSGTTAPPTTAADPTTTTEPPVHTPGKSYAFKTDSFRKYPLGGTRDRTFPAAHLLFSYDDLQDYIEQSESCYGFTLERERNPELHRDYDTVFAKYDDAWFGTHQLILVELEESSGSIRDTVKSVSRTDAGECTIVFDRHVPQVMTCDMAYYHVFIELETKDLQPTDHVSIRMDERTETSMNVQFTTR